MTLNFSPDRAQLRLVSPAPDSFEAAVADFYDRTITAVWRLAVSLHPEDTRRASDAVIEAYRTVWHAGTRDQASLLHALVVGSRPADDPADDPVPA